MHLVDHVSPLPSIKINNRIVTTLIITDAVLNDVGRLAATVSSAVQALAVR
jgi:hypothetical protein